MPAPRTRSLKLLGPSERATMKTGSYMGVSDANAAIINPDAARMKPSSRGGPLLERRPGQ